MHTRKEIVSGFYDLYDEDGRLQRTRHGQLEYATTMAYIHRYTTAASKDRSPAAALLGAFCRGRDGVLWIKSFFRQRSLSF